MYLEKSGTHERFELPMGRCGHTWTSRVWKVPDSWWHAQVKLVCEDAATGWGGWFAVTAPESVRIYQVLWFGYLDSLHEFLTVGMLGLVIGLAIARHVPQSWQLSEGSIIAVGLMGSALVGGLLIPVMAMSVGLGRVVLVALLMWAGAVVSAAWVRGRRGTTSWLESDRSLMMGAFVAVGVFYLSLVMRYDGGASMAQIAGVRFEHNPTSDNEIPQFYASRVWRGAGYRAAYNDWQSSDRPPLQVGRVLLCGGPVSWLGGDFQTDAQYAGIWFQLFWVPALWLWIRALGIGRRGTLIITMSLACTGVLMYNSIYVWPKLAAAAFALMGFTFLFTARARTVDFALAGVAFGLAWLAHGGVGFAFLALLPFCIRFVQREYWKRAGLALALFGAVVGPWLAYQKFGDPPGDRLLKLHLAGVEAINARSFGDTLIGAYKGLSWQDWWKARVENARMMADGQWGMGLWRKPDMFWMRIGEMKGLFYALGWWLPAALLPVWCWITGRDALWRNSRLAVAWTLLGLAIWDVLMFVPGSTIIHQGTMLWLLILPATIAAGLWRLSRAAYLTVALFQAVAFVRLWFPLIDPGAAKPLLAADLVMGAIALAAAVVAVAIPEESGLSVVGQSKDGPATNVGWVRGRA